MRFACACIACTLSSRSPLSLCKPIPHVSPCVHAGPRVAWEIEEPPSDDSEEEEGEEDEDETEDARAAAGGAGDDDADDDDTDGALAAIDEKLFLDDVDDADDEDVDE